MTALATAPLAALGPAGIFLQGLLTAGTGIGTDKLLSAPIEELNRAIDDLKSVEAAHGTVYYTWIMGFASPAEIAQGRPSFVDIELPGLDTFQTSMRDTAVQIGVGLEVACTVLGFVDHGTPGFCS